MLIRRAARPREHFTKIANGALRDSGISFRARGLLGYILSQSDGWSISSERLAADSPSEARDAIRTGLRELERAGYLTRERTRAPGGHFAWTGVVTDIPAGRTIDGSPVGGLPVTGQPSTVRPSISNRRRTSKEEAPLSSSVSEGEEASEEIPVGKLRAALRTPSRSVTLPAPSRKE